jgi:hypothetical protein
VRSAAYTNNLAKFINQLCLKLNADAGKDADDRATVERIANSGNDRALLKLLREETTLIVLMVRVVNQEKREEWENLHSDNSPELFGNLKTKEN